jgi:hypothetical protein
MTNFESYFIEMELKYDIFNVKFFPNHYITQIVNSFL